MSLSKQAAHGLYTRRARHYNLAIWAYRLAGSRIEWYRRLVADRLELKPGDAVVKLRCGTGLNFPYLDQALGNRGGIIGVDRTLEPCICPLARLPAERAMLGR